MPFVEQLYNRNIMEADKLNTAVSSNGIPPKDRPKVITDPAVTAETDDLNTDEAVASPEVGADPKEVEKPEQAGYGLNTDRADVGLNHDEKDDLSLN